LVIAFALVFFIVIVIRIAVELASEPAPLLTSLIMSVRSVRITCWLRAPPPGTGVGERMTVGPTPGVLAIEVTAIAVLPVLDVADVAFGVGVDGDGVPPPVVALPELHALSTQKHRAIVHRAIYR